MERRILINTAPTLEGYPRLRPDALLLSSAISSAQARVVSAGIPSADFSATGVAVPAVDVAVVATAKAGARTVAIEAATLVRDRRYIIVDEDDDDGPLEVVCASNGVGLTKLRVTAPLLRQVPAGAHLKGCCVTRTLTADETASVGDALVEWSATVDGVVVKWVDSFRVVARIPKATLTPTKLLLLRPFMRSQQMPEDLDLEATITGAWEGRLLPLIENKGLFDEDFVSDENLVPLHALACVLHVIEDDPRFERTFVDDIRKQFSQLEDVTFRRVSHDEQDQTTTPAPRDRGVDEDRGTSVSVRR